LSERVLRNERSRCKLGVWLTCTTASLLWRKTTLQKPRIYLVTGLYELAEVTARTTSARTGDFEVGISDTIIATTTGAPIGGTIGPLGDHSILSANVTMRGLAIWAASFKGLDVHFLRTAILDDTGPFSTTFIKLNEDYTSRGHLRGSSDQPTVTEQIPWTFDEGPTEQLLNANAATIQIEDVAELLKGDDEVASKYWKWFDVVERYIVEGISNLEMARATDDTNQRRQLLLQYENQAWFRELLDLGYHPESIAEVLIEELCESP
jgi:hypothetical protein